MSLREIFIQRVESLGPIIWKRAFGWIIAVTSSRKFFLGYKVIDDNDINMILLLSSEGFKKAMEESLFEKFEFGKTWVEGEITSEEELDRIWEFILDAYDFAKEREGK